MSECAIDPVCGKVLDLADAVAMENDDTCAHFFCSDHCRSVFRAAPNQYMQDRAPHGAATREHGD